METEEQLKEYLEEHGKLPPLDSKPPVKKRDLLWEALVEVCGADSAEMTKSERGRFNKALSEIRAAGASPQDIHRRAQVYRTKWTGIDVTPTGLAAHWSSLKPKPSSSPPPFEPEPVVVEVTPEQAAAAARARDEFFQKLRDANIGGSPDDI